MNDYWDYNTFYGNLPAPCLNEAQSIIYIETKNNIPENINTK